MGIRSLVWGSLICTHLQLHSSIIVVRDQYILIQFTEIYTTTVSLQLAVVVIHCLLINFTHKIKYNKLVNPIVMLAPFLIVQYIIIRIGVLAGYFYPNALQDATYGNIIQQYFSNIKYINIFGIVP